MFSIQNQLVKCSLLFLVSLPFSYEVIAGDLYVAGQLGQSKLFSDDYFQMQDGEAKLDDKAVNYAIAAGLSLTKQLHLELEVGLQKAFVATSSFDYSHEMLAIEDSYARVNAKYNFKISRQFEWYLKGGLGIARVEQVYQNSIGSEDQKTVENVFSPAVAIGIQKRFDRSFSIYLQTQYSGYRLKAGEENLYVSYGTLAGGISWAF